MPKGKASLIARARRVRLLILDVDGVLTDGRILLGSDGHQVKAFDVQDGFGIVLAHQAGIRTAIITAERSEVVRLRAKRLKIGWVAQFARDKRRAFEACLKHFHLEPQAAAYVGDDLLDLPVLTRVGFSVAVANAHPEAKRRVHYVTSAPGGRGAVREVVEMILKAQGLWPDLIGKYTK